MSETNHADSSKTGVLFRPSEPRKGQISFLRRPGIVIAELVYDPATGCLQFAVQQSGETKYVRTVKDGGQVYKPLGWMLSFARASHLGLPSKAEPYESLTSLITSGRDVIHHYFDCDPVFEAVATLYVPMTWVYERFDALPYLRFLGEPGTGKSTGNLAIGALCYRGFNVGGSQTAAPLYRMIEDIGGTMLLDEADFNDSQIGTDVAKILNSGYRQGFPVIRCNKDRGFVPEVHAVFGPKIFNGRKEFQDDAVETRCLTCKPMETQRNDVPLQFTDEFYREAASFRNRALSWRLANLDLIQPSTERIAGLGARPNQIAIPLLTIVELIEDSDLRKQYRTHLLNFIQQTREDRQEIKQEKVEARLIEAYIELSGNGNSSPTCQMIAACAVKLEKPNDPKIESWLTPKKAGSMLRELGFKNRHSKTGNLPSIEPHRLKTLAAQYGVNVEGEHGFGTFTKGER